MEQKLNNTDKILQYRHISSATSEIINYMSDRKYGKVKSLKTRWRKFNAITMGGIEPNAIYTIAGISGSGKSSFVNTLETDLIDLNTDEDLIVLSFSFEIKNILLTIVTTLLTYLSFSIEIIYYNEKN